MKKFFLVIAVFSLMVFSAPPASAVMIEVDLIDYLDVYADGILKLGDGYGSIPADLDYFNESFVAGAFTLGSVASDNAFSFQLTTEGVQSSPYFKINNNAHAFTFNEDESGLLFSDFFNLGSNDISIFVPTLSGSNLDDYNIHSFKLFYDAVPSSGSNEVPEPMTVALFSMGFAGMVLRRKFG